ncbi:hypothetical protein AB0873_22040 [Micromonospora sp. NPDC047707]
MGGVDACVPPDDDVARRPVGVGVPAVPVGRSVRAIGASGLRSELMT